MAVEKTLGFSTDKLGDIAKIKTGSRNNQDKNPDGQFPFFVRSQEVERINTFSYSDEAILIPGEGNIGEIVHYVNEPHEVHQRVYRISNFNPKVYSLYIYWYLRVFFKAHTEKYTVKATVDSLRLPTFQEFEITYPDIEEQKAIAKALSDIDEMISILGVLHNKKRNLKKALVEKMLAKDNSSFTECNLSELGIIVRGVTYKPETDLTIESVNAHTLLRSNAIFQSSLTFADSYFVRSEIVKVEQEVKNGDVLICMANGSKDLVGKSAYCDVDSDQRLTFGSFMGVFRPKIHSDGLFVTHLFQTEFYRNFIETALAGSSINNLTPNLFQNFKIMVPEVKIRAKIGEQLALFDDEMDSISTEIHKYECIKQGMMNDLLTGKVRLV